MISRIIENPLLTIPGPEDWSRVRSPSRARRRRRRGHRQNIVSTKLPDPKFYMLDDHTMTCHPVMAAKFRAALEEKHREIGAWWETSMLNAIRGML